MDNFILKPGGLKCIVNKNLPVEEYCLASDIETKKEVKLLTGSMIECFKLGDTLYMSQKVYDTLFSKAKSLKP